MAKRDELNERLYEQQSLLIMLNGNLEDLYFKRDDLYTEIYDTESSINEVKDSIERLNYLLDERG